MEQVDEFRKVVSWKTTFYGNIGKDGGAMSHVIKNRQPNQIIINSITKKFGRIWASITQLKMLEMIESDRGIYEVISSYPHKVYFDIDGDNTCISLDKIKEIITKYFPDAIMAISGSITDKKHSYHIILSNYVIHNEQELLYVKNVVLFIFAHECKSFDTKVYTKNRNMKCINQSKVDDFRVQSIIEDDDYRHHLITCFVEEYSIPFKELEDDIAETFSIETAKTRFDLAILPKLKLSEPDKFDITTATPLDILKIIPVSKNHNHSYTHYIARYSYYNKITFPQFIGWISNKHNPMTADIQNKWEIHWSKLDKYPTVSRKSIEAVLAFYYTNIKTDRSYKSFLNRWDLSNQNIKKIDTITPCNFDVPDKFIIFNVGMGGGKTTQTIDYIKKLDPVDRICWVCPNKSLAHNTLHRLKQNKINCESYLSYNADEKRNGKLNTLKNLVIVANSLHYYNQEPEVVIIDEIETLLDKFLGDFMAKQSFDVKRTIWANFVNMLRKAKRVIFLDAFITKKTLDFIQRLTIETYQPPIIYERFVEPSTRNIVYINSFNLMVNKILDALQNNKKCFIFYPLKAGMSEFPSMAGFDKLLSSKSGKKGVFYNADIDDLTKKTLRDVNSFWKPLNYVITNTIITCGVNYDVPSDFDESFIFVGSYNSPRDIAQVSYRVRDLRTQIIYVSFLGNMNQTNSFKIDTSQMNCPLYKSLLDDILTEKYSPLKKTLTLFFNKAHYKQSTSSEVLSNTISKYIDELLSECCVGFSYANIDDIDARYAELITNKIMIQTAEMMEKIMLRKYFFELEFTKDAADLYDHDSEISLDRIWDDKYLFFFDRLKYIKTNPDNLFSRISAFNKFKNLFPTEKEFKSVKLSDDLIAEIFREFTFKFITPTSSKTKILKDVYNTFFAKNIITTTYKEKDTNGTTTIDDVKLNDMHAFSIKYQRIGATTTTPSKLKHIDSSNDLMDLII